MTLEVAPPEEDGSDGVSTKVAAYRLLRPYENESKPEVGGEEVGGEEGAEEEEEEEEIGECCPSSLEDTNVCFELCSLVSLSQDFEISD